MIKTDLFCGRQLTRMLAKQDHAQFDREYFQVAIDDWSVQSLPIVPCATNAAIASDVRVPVLQSS